MREIDIRVRDVKRRGIPSSSQRSSPSISYILFKNVFIGSNAVILPGVKIPDNTIVGAGSVVIRSIKQPGTYFGNPAKKIF